LVGTTSCITVQKQIHIRPLSVTASDPQYEPNETVKVLFYPTLPDFRKITALWEVPTLHPLVLLVAGTCRWRRAWSISGM